MSFAKQALFLMEILVLFAFLISDGFGILVNWGVGGLFGQKREQIDKSITVSPL